MTNNEITPSSMERLREEFWNYSGHGLDEGLFEAICEFWLSRIPSLLKEAEEKIAEMVADAGNNGIALLSDKGSFTGTYWISANNLYFLLTGKHLNQAFEDGDVPKNEYMEELSAKEPSK